jgi:predicted DNA-binding transcriptional regulator AlpA
VTTTEPKIPLVVTLRWLMAEGVVGSRRTLYRQIGDGTFPMHDCKVGHKIAWKRATIKAQLEKARMI